MSAILLLLIAAAMTLATLIAVRVAKRYRVLPLFVRVVGIIAAVALFLAAAYMIYEFTLIIKDSGVY